MWLAASVGEPAYDFAAPAGPRFTDEEKAAQRDRGREVARLVRDAFDRGAAAVTIPPGDYRFAKDGWDREGAVYALHFRDMQREADHPFRIIADGVTLWFEFPVDQAPHAHHALGFTRCRNISLEGATLDRDPRGNVEGRITQLDPEANRIEIELVAGSALPATFSGNLNQRIIPFNADGSFCTALYAIQHRPGGLRYRGIEPGSAAGRVWVLLDEKSELLKTNASPEWRSRYGEAGTLDIGDGLSLVYSTTVSIGVFHSAEMRFINLKVFITKGGVIEQHGGGGHLWKDCLFGPRPGSSQWQGADGFLTGCLERGSIYDGITIRNTTDDLMNIHGHWGYIESAEGRSITLRRGGHAMPARVGDRLTFFDAHSAAIRGDATVVAVGDGTLELDREATSFAGAIAENPAFQCRGWQIRNSTFTDGYQRLLVQGGADGVICNNTFRRVGSRIELHSNFFTNNEGGVCRSIRIHDNQFEDMALHPGGTAIMAGFVPLDHKPARGLVTDIAVERNAFRGYGAHAVVFEGVSRGSVVGNTFAGPVSGDQPVRLVECTDIVTGPPAPRPPLGVGPRPGTRVMEGYRLVEAASPERANGTISLAFDEEASMFVCGSRRVGICVPDNRLNSYWIEDDLAARTIADREAKYRKHAGRVKGGFEIYSSESDFVRKLVDRDGDGLYEAGTVFADGFATPVSGIGSGVFSLDGTLYYSNIPDIWSLRDEDGDGVADVRRSLFHGFGVRDCFFGHDLNALVLAPDGRLYGTMADRGLDLTTPEGRHFAYPNQGTLFRFDPDGSNFEIVFTGLRNPKEIAYDDAFNLVTVDNNGDMGDEAKVYYLLEGGDGGWRMEHQTIAQFITDIGLDERPPMPWVAERMYDSHVEAGATQPAFLLPPIHNLTHGPSGLAFHPGTGFDAREQGRFQICNYRMEASRSLVESFRIVPEGAGFIVPGDHDVLVEGLGVTDLAYGPDGRLFLADYETGAGFKEGKGRIVALESTDADAQRRSREQAAEAAGIIRDGLRSASADRLAEWLGHGDQRVRVRAQLELAGRPEATAIFERVLAEGKSLARRHAVWGLWVRARRARDAGATAALAAVLADSDPEVRGQAARAMGEAVGATPSHLHPLLADPHPRVAAFAAISLGRIGARESMPVIADRLRRLDWEPRHDPFLRHGLIMGIAGCGTDEDLAALAADPCETVRLAAVVALRRHRSLAVASLVRDSSPAVAFEAVRALHDQYITPWHEARPALADLLADIVRGTPWHSLDDVMANRLLHATFRCGRDQDLETLLQVATSNGFSPLARREALRLASLWQTPPRIDQSLGVYDPLPARVTDMRPFLERHLPPLLRPDSEFAADAVAVLQRCGVDVAALPFATQVELIRSAATRPDYRSALLDLMLGRTETAEAEQARSLCVELLGADDVSVAAKALTLLTRFDPTTAEATARGWVELSDVGRAKAGWQSLGTLPGPEAASRIVAALGASSPTHPGALLELIEAAGARPEKEVADTLAAWKRNQSRGDPLAIHAFAIEGGDAIRGRKVFEAAAAAKCTQCHKIESAAEGHAPVLDVGGIGPNLAGLSRRADARSILQSLVDPSAVIVPGYGTVSLVLDDGTVATGVVVEETPEIVRLRGADPTKPDAVRTIRSDTIESRSTPISAMPSMAPILKPRELRDLVAFLRSL